jgi:molecular chaperone DnaK (HSP70)
MTGTVAIDLGSSSTVVAFQAPGEAPRLLALPPYSLQPQGVVPTLLWLPSAEASTALIGRQVIDANLADHPGPELQRDFKRLIGHSPSPVEQSPGLPLSPEQAGERLLRQLWSALPQDIQPERLVLTAPIDGYGGYRGWLLQLASAFNVEEVALVDEPTAAAIGCGLPPGSTVLVIDLGGGTCDLSLVQLEGGEGKAAPIAQLLRLRGQTLNASRQHLRCAKVIGKAGLAIGGRDIDRWIAAALLPQAPMDATLLQTAEQLKCQLSEQPLARSLYSHGDGSVHDLQYSETQLAELLEHQGLFNAFDGLLEAVLAQGRQAGIGLEQIDAVVPVGGTSRLSSIQRWMSSRLGSRPMRNQQPIEAVALGALALTPGVRVRDVLSRGVAVRCWDRRSSCHRWHPLYVGGQAWPTEEPLELILACSRDGQEAIEIVLGEPLQQRRTEVVFQDGLPQLQKRSSLAQEVAPWPQQALALPLEPAGSAGEDRLRLRFSIDEACELILRVEDLHQEGVCGNAHRLGRLR